ncbi:hypothetical protein RclHR1_02520012 [Rhizophagus clarus]|uniref:Uncharacterized protein n=1 Tax=Rhizophagus clarus TaxID=94130 RepID=A0A2Z6QZ13_9GLOM|nr:hypothetical protein RclHR1_02520012 [Rhizophagus clarus]
MQIFIENEVNLRTLEIGIVNICFYRYFNNILELILQNRDFIHNISNLSVHTFEINLDKIFEQLNVLGSVHIINCSFQILVLLNKFI